MRETFPYKLYSMLESVCDSDQEGIMNCDEKPIAWSPEGNSFLILNERELFEKVVPLHFSLTKMRSFTRQLNLWGFTRVPEGSEKIMEWQHPHFLRNDPARLSLIKRTAIRSKELKNNFGPIGPIGHNQGDESSVPVHCGMTGLGSNGHLNLNAFTVKPIPDMNTFQLGYIDSSSYMMPLDHVAISMYHQESLRPFFKNNYYALSVQEHMTQYSQCQAFQNKSFPGCPPNGGFTFDSPVFRENAPDKAPCLKASEHTITSPLNKTTYDACLMSESFGLGDDHYVLSELEEDNAYPSTENFSSKVERCFTAAENTEQVIETNDINEHEKNSEDVSDIDFDAFMLE